MPAPFSVPCAGCRCLGSTPVRSLSSLRRRCRARHHPRSLSSLCRRSRARRRRKAVATAADQVDAGATAADDVKVVAMTADDHQGLSTTGAAASRGGPAQGTGGAGSGPAQGTGGAGPALPKERGGRRGGGPSDAEPPVSGHSGGCRSLTPNRRLRFTTSTSRAMHETNRISRSERSRVNFDIRPPEIAIRNASIE